MNRDELLLKILDNFNSSDNISTRDLIMLFEDTPKEDKKIERIDCWYQYDDTNDKVLTKIMLDELKNKINEIIDRLNGEDNEI